MRTAYSIRRRAGVLAALCAVGCGTARLYEGAPRSAGDVAIVHVGSTTVRGVDGQARRGGAFDAETLELTPGPHELTLVFELPARTMGLRALPAQEGVGTCVLAFDASAGHQYYLVARARDELSPRWDGSWEAWVRDPLVADEDDIIARCTAASAGATPRAHPSARRVPPPAVAASPPTPAAVPSDAGAPPATALPPLRLGTWNLRGFGRLPGKDMARIAAAIAAHFDILTLTELSGDGGPAALRRLELQLGREWGGMIAPIPHPPADRPTSEYTAVLYRRARVRPCADWERLRELPDAATAGLLRAPSVGCFEAGPPGRPSLDFLLATYHATAADGDAGLVAHEAAHLDGIFSAMALLRPGEDDLILAGDFNLEAVELATVTRAAAPSDGGGTTLDLLGNRTPRRTDHLLFRDARATAAVLGAATAIDVRDVAPTPADYYRSVSDHLPIVIELRVADPDAR